MKYEKMKTIARLSAIVDREKLTISYSYFENGKDIKVRKIAYYLAYGYCDCHFIDSFGNVLCFEDNKPIKETEYSYARRKTNFIKYLRNECEIIVPNSVIRKYSAW